MKFRVIIFFSIVTITSCAQAPKTVEAWLEQNLIVLDSNGTYDFTALGEIIGDKRIVALGESSHGIGEFYTLKSELIQYLHKEKGFEVLAMEGGLGDINLAYSTIDTLTSEQLRDNTLFPNFRTKEINPLIEYIFETKDSDVPLLYTGFDTQISTSYCLKKIEEILKPYDPELSAQILPVLGAQFKIMNEVRANDSLGYDVQRDLFIDTANKAKATILQNETEIQEQFNLNPFQFKVIERALSILQKSADLPYNESWRFIELRDQLMAENFEWLLQEVFPNKKVVIWAHNGHIDKGGSANNSFTMMGHRLKETFKDDYYALGLFAYKGEAYQHWTQKVIPFENSGKASIEKTLTETKKRTSFLNLDNVEKSPNTRWLFETVDALEFENGGKVSFVPKKRFDGLITVYESAAPTYDEK